MTRILKVSEVVKNIPPLPILFFVDEPRTFCPDPEKGIMPYIEAEGTWTCFFCKAVNPFSHRTCKACFSCTFTPFKEVSEVGNTPNVSEATPSEPPAAHIDFTCSTTDAVEMPITCPSVRCPVVDDSTYMEWE